MDIYIKPNKKVTIAVQNSICVKDIADVFAEHSIQKRVESIKILKPSDERKAYLISVMDIIKAIDAALPGNTITNVGEMDTLLEYSPRPVNKNVLWKWMKITFVSAVLLAGASTAIMSFHNDAQMPKVFQTYYRMFFGVEIQTPLIIDIPYSIGLAVGIVVFFNHFMGKKITNDPTPIEVELSLYENDVSDTLIEMLSNKQNDKGNRSENGGA